LAFLGARKSADELGLRLLDFLVAVFCKPDAPLVLAIDDTLFGRSGRRVFGAHYLHDGSQPAGQGRRTRWGNCWVKVALVVCLPCLGGRAICLPVLFRLFRPKTAEDQARPSQPELARAPVGTGPYRLVSFVPDDRVVLAPNPDYFEGPPRNRGIELKVVPDDTMRGLELRKGTVDIVVNDLAPDIVHQLEQEGRLRTKTAPGTDFAYLGLNLRDPILRDRRVRHALGFGIDRQAIVDYLRRGLATPAVGIVPEASWAFEPDVFRFHDDPALARRLLDEAGFLDPDGDGPAPRFRLSLQTSTSEVYRVQAAVIQHDLREIGIEVDVRSHEFATLYADVLRGQFQMYTLQWVGVTDPDMLRRVFHSGQVPPAGFNRGFYANPEVDRAIDAATLATDDRTRRRLYGEAQRLIAEDAPYVPLWTKTNVAVFGPDLRGVVLSPVAAFTFLKDVFRE